MHFKAKIYDLAFNALLVWWTYRHLELCPYLISEVRAAKQTMTGTARVSVTAWDGRGGRKKRKKSGDDKKGTVDRQTTSDVTVWYFYKAPEREASLEPSQHFRQMKWECASSRANLGLLSSPAVRRTSSPAATGNQTISRREIKGPISPSGTCKHGNSVWKTLPSSCKVLLPAVSGNALKQHFLDKGKNK